MLKRALAIICLFGLLVVSLGACGQDDGSNAALTYPIPSQPRSLDPQLAEPAAENIIANCFEGLVVSFKEDEYLPGVAEKWDISADGLIYTFHLRENAKWHKLSSFEKTFGKATADKLPDLVTAHDFVFAFRRALDPQTNSPKSSELFVIKNASEVNQGKAPVSSLAVEATDNHTLKVTLLYPHRDFLKILTSSMCMPCNLEFFEATGGKYGLGDDFIMCNGPFYLSAWNPDHSFFVRKNKDYWAVEKVLPASVTFRINPNTEQYLQKLQQGTYCAAPISSQTKFVSDDSVSFQTLENEVRLLALNCADPVLRNEKLRLSLLSALDETTLQPLREGGLSTDLAIPSCCLKGAFVNFSNSRNLIKPAFDKHDAASLFETALSELEKKSVSIEFICPEEFERPVRALLQVWQKTFGVAISAKVTSIPRTELEERVKKGNYQFALTSLIAQSSSLGDHLRAFLSDSPTNIINFQSDLYDSLLESSGLATDDSALLQQYVAAHNLLIQGGALLPLSLHSNYMALAKGVSGLYYSSAAERVYFISAVKID